MIFVAAICAAILAGLTPTMLRELPEPENSNPGKIPYARLAQTPNLAISCAVLAALGAGTITYQASEHFAMPVWIVLCAAGVALSFIDLRTRLLPFAIVAPTTLTIVILLLLATSMSRDWSGLVRALTCAVAVWGFYRLSWQLSKKSIGYGDVRLSFAIGACLGHVSITATIVGVWLGFAIGSILALLTLKNRSLATHSIPFGPAMIAGAVMSLAIYVP